MGKIGVTIPTYQRQDKLEEILATIPESVKVYLSDNGATLPKDFQKEKVNVRINKVTPVVPMFSNWTKAGMSAEEEWLILPSDDDLFMPNAFEAINGVLTSCSDEVGMVIFGHHAIDGDGEVLSTWSPDDKLYPAPSGFSVFQYGVPARMPSIVIRTKVFRELGGFCEDFKLTASDSDFIQRASLVADVQFVSTVISGYRIWEGGATANTIATFEWMQEIEMWCNRIESFCRVRNIHVYSSHIRDEIYASNLSAGISLLRKQGLLKHAWKHFWKCRYPFRAPLKTQLRIIYHLFRL